MDGIVANEGDRLDERAETVGATLRGRAAFAVRRRRRGIAYAIAATAAAFVVGAVSIGGWRYYSDSRVGRVELLTEGEPVVAQVLDASSDSAIGEPFDLATRAVVSLPDGDYRLRVNGEGRMGRTYRFAVNRGETQAHTISIDEGLLIGGGRALVPGGGADPRAARIRFPHVLGAREVLAGKADFIEFERQSLIRRDGATGKVIWDALHPAKAFASDRDPVRWMHDAFYPARSGGLMKQVPDLNGDGVGDLVLFNDFTPAVLAVSGKDGSMLWNYVAELNGQGGPRDLCPEAIARARPPGEFGAGGTTMIDVDRDGTPDVCATFVFEKAIPAAKEDGDSSSSFVQTDARRRRSLVVGLSGRSGRCLWTHPVEPDFVETKGEDEVKPAEVVRGRRSNLLAFVAQTQWLGLDPVTGRVQVGPLELGFTPARPVAHADLDGDGEPEVVTVEAGPGGRDWTLRVWSIGDGHPVWSQTIDAGLDSLDGSPPSCSLVADLDGDGRSEVVVPDAGPMPPLAGYRGVRLLDGRTGATRWRRALRVESTEEDGVAEIIAAPDLDGDGTREVVIVSLVLDPDWQARVRQRQRPEPERIWVDVLSGKDGRPLWWWNVDVPEDELSRIRTPFWWGRGPDGWPLLAIPLDGSAHFGPGYENDPGKMREVVYLLEASTGRERHAITGLTRASLADLDGDGLDDLWGDVNGELRAFRGEGAEVWRTLGSFQPAMPTEYRWDARGSADIDLDGDGIVDVVSANLEAPSFWSADRGGSRTAMARSGRDGHAIWKTALQDWESWLLPDRGETYTLAAFPLPAGDFDGDGTPDVIVTIDETDDDAVAAIQATTLPVQVLSGRTGARLWSSGSLPSGVRSLVGVAIMSAEARMVEPGGAPDLIVCHRGSYFAPGAVVPAGAADIVTERLARLSGRDGRVIWDISLSDKDGGTSLVDVARLEDNDLDGDGGRDIVLGPSGSGNVDESDRTLIAISLRDGTRIWSRPLENSFSSAEFEILVAAGDGPGRQKIIVLDELDGGDRLDLRVRAFDGRSGEPVWSTKPGGMRSSRPSNQGLALADFDGNKKPFVCVSFSVPGGTRRIVVLGPNGEECARRYWKWTAKAGGGVSAADMNGDGRDELVGWGGGRLQIFDRELKDVWGREIGPDTMGFDLKGRSGRGREVLISPALGLDAATGRPVWTGNAPLVADQFAPYLLDPGDATRGPRLIANGLNATVCRMAMDTGLDGRIAEPRGRVVKAGIARDDPRWRRPLPWVCRLRGAFGPWGLLTAMGLAVVSVHIPILIIRLARGRRRKYTIRALMSVPVAVAVPLLVYLTVVPRLPQLSASPLLATDGRMFVTGTLVGVPVVACLVWALASVVRRRWWGLVGMAGLVMIGTLVVGAGWMWVDRKAMAVGFEHYGWEGWGVLVMAGAYVAAVMWGVCRQVVVVYGWVRGLNGG